MHHSFDKTFTGCIACTPDVLNLEPSVLQEVTPLLFSPLHPRKDTHHIQILMRHEGRRTLSRHDPLVDEQLAVIPLHDITNWMEDLEAFFVTPIV